MKLFYIPVIFCILLLNISGSLAYSRRSLHFQPWAISLVRKLNQYRSSPFCIDPRLTEAAHNHAFYASVNNYYSHTEFYGRQGYTGQDVGMRARAQNFHGGVGENMMKGCAGPNEDCVVSAWINSPPHFANIRNPQFTRVGVARVPHPYEHGKWMWVMVAGSDTRYNSRQWPCYRV